MTIQVMLAENRYSLSFFERGIVAIWRYVGPIRM
jgi:hypothetical protein